MGLLFVLPPPRGFTMFNWTEHVILSIYYHTNYYDHIPLRGRYRLYIYMLLRLISYIGMLILLLRFNYFVNTTCATTTTTDVIVNRSHQSGVCHLPSVRALHVRPTSNSSFNRAVSWVLAAGPGPVRLSCSPAPHQALRVLAWRRTQCIPQRVLQWSQSRSRYSSRQQAHRARAAR